MPENYCLPAEEIEAWRKAILQVHSNWKSRGRGFRDSNQELIEHASKFDNYVFSSRMADTYNSLGSDINLFSFAKKVE
jgi:hypothetical protein